MNESKTLQSGLTHIVSQKQVKKPYMMKGGKLPKAQTGPTNKIREMSNSILSRDAEQKRKELDK